MNNKNSFYLTTTLPYVNAKPHIGFAMEIIHADIIARAKKLQGFEVFFNTGTDEHGQKIWQKSEEVGQSTQEYVDEYALKYKKLQKDLGLIEDIHFVRTSDDHHKKSAQEFWKLCDKAGDIYKKNYKIKYCVGCELEKTDSELVDGCCPIHSSLELEIREEENYFFRFSNFGQRLIDLYDNNKDFVIPDFRLNEIRALIKRGLEDFSISRLKEKMPWGVSVPGDDNHVMYVWFDALVNYVSTLGWPEDKETFDKFWKNGTPVQMAGKDQVRQQSAMWQAMLLSAGLPPTRHIVIHGFINYDGQKMSKSLGNVVLPEEIIEEYGLDALRYFVAREFNQFEDSDISNDKLKLSYNTGLANGLGNLVSRVMKMAEDHLASPVVVPETEDMQEFFAILNKFEINTAINYVWSKMSGLDQEIQEKLPFKVIKEDPERGREMIKDMVLKVYSIALMLEPFMPETADRIKSLVKANKMPKEPLFPRLD